MGSETIPLPPGSLLQRAAGWLRRVPIADPVARRHAFVLQILLLLLATLPPALWLYRAVWVEVPWRPGETVALAASLGISVLALLDCWLIRAGRFQWAVRLLLAALAAAMMLAHLGSGFAANRFEQPIQAVWLILAGLMAGRRALWLMYGWTVLTFAAGVAVDIGGGRFPDDTPVAMAVDGLVAALIFLFIAIMVDRSVSALRESLDEANRRGDELGRANARLQAEIAERERMQERLIHAQKVEAVGRLASGIAHDFNHLLGLIVGYAELGRKSSDLEQLRQSLSGIESAARRASAVSGKLLSFGRPEATRYEVFDAGAALREMRPMLRQLFGTRVRLLMTVPEDPRPIRFDRLQFELVILNIAANAEQAMPEGGTFTLALDGGAGPQVEIELRDTGHGMEEAVRARIFEPFFTTKPAGQGSGLGLAVAHDLVAEAGGVVSVESRPGAGSRFLIRLPLAAGREPAADA